MEVPAVMRGSQDLRKGIRLWVMKNVVFIVIIAAILIIGSGRLDWGMAWAYIVAVALIEALTFGVLYRIDPSLLAERSGYQEGAKKWDMAIASLVAVWLPLAIYLIAALNDRFGWAPQPPFWLQAAGLCLVAIGGLIVLWAMAANRFFSAVVRVQGDRGHTVAASGPYRLIRHPGYLGAILLNPGTGLALGSFWALVPAALIVVLYVVRTSLEDGTLQKELAGYREYAGKVRYRLLPGVW